MELPDAGAAIVTATINAINLALTAWIISTTKRTQRDLRKNTRVTTEARDSAAEVKEKTNGALERLIARLEAAATKAERAVTKNHPRAPPAARKKRKRPRGK